MRHRHRTLVMVGVLTTLLLGAVGRAEPADPPRLWFPVGEELVYQLKWGIIPIGKSRITSAWVEENGRRLLHIRYRTLTNALFNRIYPMNDEAESIIDPVTFLPVRFVFKKARRKPVCDEVLTFNHENGTAALVSACAGTKREFAMEPGTRDIISFMYWMRRQPIDAKLDASYTVMVNEGPAQITLKADKTEPVELPVFGKVSSLLVKPAVNLDSMLVESGRLSMWVSRDARCIATRLMVKATVANVRATLCRVTGPGDDSWSRAMAESTAKDACPDDTEEEERELRTSPGGK